MICTSVFKVHYFRIFDVWNWKCGKIEDLDYEIAVEKAEMHRDAQRCLKLKLIPLRSPNPGISK